MIFTSLTEVLSIGAVVPLLAVYTSPESVFSHYAVQPVVQLLEIDSPEGLLLPITAAFGLGTLVAGVLRLSLLWVNTKLAHSTAADLSVSIYRRTLYQPYSIHCSRNSSEIIDGILNKTNVIIYIISLFLTLAGSFVILLAVLLAAFSVDLLIATSSLIGFALVYIPIVWLTRKRLAVNSQLVARESVHVIKSLQEGMGGIRDVLIDGSQDTYCKIYRNADMPLRRAQGENSFLAASPRYVVEAIGMILICILAYVLTLEPGGADAAIPILAGVALAAQRVLPILQQAYAAFTGIRGSYASLQDALELLDQPLPEHAVKRIAPSLVFRSSIRLKQVRFRYEADGPYIFDGLELLINRGARIGFVGSTGSGKSTLLDIIMGLLQPTQGSLEVDGKVIEQGNSWEWQAHIAHVPQSIFLSDNTIEQNIAFGVAIQDVDRVRVRQAATQAQIASTIESWPHGYQTFIGERGIRLSGGQRQRIGIARALYKRADVIILDEATSALDNKTEQDVMQAIEYLSDNLTLLISAHRLTTLKNCTQIVELDKGRIKRVGSYAELVGQ